jgi:hypothetical protein
MKTPKKIWIWSKEENKKKSIFFKNTFEMQKQIDLSVLRTPITQNLWL